MINVEHFRLHVVRPALARLGASPGGYQLWSQAAENLLIGTALVESRLRHLYQLPSGPARGLYQIEPTTHDDLYHNTLRFNTKLGASLNKLAVPFQIPLVDQLITNLEYATGVARLLYWRITEPLPEAWDQKGLAGYWGDHYNTVADAEDEKKFVRLYDKHGRASEPGADFDINEGEEASHV